MRRAFLTITLIMSFTTSALAGPPIDGPKEPSTRSFDPPAPLTDANVTKPKTWEEKHLWEERGTLVGILSGAAVGAGGVVALFTMIPRDPSVPSSPEGDAAFIGVVALYAGALGAYGGGLLGAGVGMVIDAAQ